MLVLVITPEGEVTKRDIEGDLASMQEIVGGLIQPIDVLPDCTVWVNEEGIVNGLPFNPVATFWTRMWHDVTLFGTAFMTGGVDEEGNILPLKEEYADLFIKRYQEVMS